MHRLAAFLLVLLFVVPAAADEKESEEQPREPLTPQQSADKALRAVKDEDGEALKSLAAKAEPDPWLVAEALAFRGEHDAAAAFAKAAPRALTKMLPAYVETLRKNEPDRALLKVSEVMRKAALRGDHEALLAAAAKAPGALDSVTRIVMEHDLGVSLGHLRRPAESRATLVRAGKAAAELGALQLAMSAHFKAGGVAYRQQQPGPAIESMLEVAKLAEALGNGSELLRALKNIAVLSQQIGRLRAAIDAYERMVPIYDASGKRSAAASAMNQAGQLYRRVGEREKALAAYMGAVERCLELGEDENAAIGIGNMGHVLVEGQAPPKVIAGLEALIADAKERGMPAAHARALAVLGDIQTATGDADGAVRLHAEALGIAEAAADQEQIAIIATSRGVALAMLGRYDEAMADYERALAIRQAQGSKLGEARILTNIGTLLSRRGDNEEARAAHERALEVAEAAKDWQFVASVCVNLGNIHRNRGDQRKALALFQRAHKLFQAGNNQWGVARALANLGTIHRRLGEHDEATRVLERALVAARTSGQEGVVSSLLHELGQVQQDLGHFPAALDLYGRALALKEEQGDKEGIAVTLNNMANFHKWIGHTEKAFELLERALDIVQELKDTHKSAIALLNLGTLHAKVGRYEEALRMMERARPLFAEVGNKRGQATVLAAVGTVYDKMKEYAKAVASYEAARPLAVELESRRLEATLLLGIGIARLKEGAHDEALARFAEAGETIGEEVAPKLTAQIAEGRAEVALRQERWTEAIRAARTAVLEAEGMLTGYAEGEGADARETFSRLYDLGTRASIRSKDPASLTWFVEHGRAGSLLEALGARDALQSAVIPEGLQASLTEARLQERLSVEAARKAAKSGQLRAMRAAQDAVSAARAEVQEVVGAIQRQAKAGADIVYPRPEELAQIRAHVAANEALVIYQLTVEEGAALVIRAGEARLVALPSSADIREACDGLLLEDAPYVDPEGVARLRKLVIEPLGLAADAKRVLVSPMGRLGYVPFALLLPDREIAYVPSGTTYGLLKSEGGSRGTGILAVGDPDYGTGMRKSALALHRDGRQWARLPRLAATREEVAAVGTVRLLGKAATESGVKAALAKASRWRAVHFACHGLVNPDQPLLSSLALTADEKDDGFLTCLEVFRWRVPADLVVLSACETGKGRIYLAEGIVGLTRAFMFSGAPRVICSLWKVDDKATQAMMIKFYELWNPKEGKGLDAAAALKQAQAHVRSQDEWKHPYYWAAWVLWGLPE